MKKSKKVSSALLMGALCLSMVFTAACSKKTTSSNTASDSLVITVGDTKVNMSEMMYYIYAVEAEGNYYEQMYQQYYGTSYWDAEYEEGKTMRDQTKDFLVETVVMYEVLNDKAVKAGYTVTDEEKTEAESYADQILTSLSAEQLEITGFDKDILTKVQEKLILGEKYYNEIIDGLALNEEEITATVNKADYDEYTTEYIFGSLKTYDDAGQVVDLSDDEKSKLKTSMEDALTKVKAGTSFADSITADSGLETSTLVFLNGGTEAEEEYQKAAISLKNDEYTDSIVATDYGYYIIKMVDNDSTTEYDEAVASAISAAEQEGFDTAYQALLEDYKYTVNEDVWGPLVMGTITIVETDTTSTEE